MKYLKELSEEFWLSLGYAKIFYCYMGKNTMVINL